MRLEKETLVFNPHSLTTAFNSKVDKRGTVTGSLNSVYETGFYKVGSTVTDGPPEISSGTMIVANGDGESVIQMIFHSGGNIVFVRSGTYNPQSDTATWGSWDRLPNMSYSDSKYVLVSGDTMTGILNMTPLSGEGGEIHLNASATQTTQSGISLEQYNGTLKLSGIPSADEETVIGTGKTIQIDPYYSATSGLFDASDYVFNTKEINIGSGGNLNLKAASGSTDSGDIIFLDGSGNEVGRIYNGDNGTAVNFRINATGGLVFAYSSQQIAFKKKLSFNIQSDGTLIRNCYNDSWYNLIRNHNNGDISISASGSGLYLGYENTNRITIAPNTYHNNNIILNAEYQILAKTSRKVVNGGGWAYVPYRFIGNDDAVFAGIGAYGAANDLTYMYLGSGMTDSWTNEANMRIYPTGMVWAKSLRLKGNISYEGTKSTGDIIRFLDNTDNVNGNGIAIGNGGATIIGGGESSSTCQSLLTTAQYGGEERMIIANDGNIEFYSNVQSGTASAYTMTFNNAGRLLIGGSTQTGDRYVRVENDQGKVELDCGSTGNHGVYSDTHSSWIIYQNKTDNIVLIPKQLRVSFMMTNQGNKTAWNDGVAGTYIGADGTIQITHATGNPYIGFHRAGSTTATSALFEPASGLLAVSGNFTTNSKTQAYGGVKGIWLGNNGNITLTYDGGGAGLYFCYNKATNYTASIKESSSGVITINSLTLGAALPVGSGGTGKTTGKAAANYFMNELEVGSSTPVDADYYISQYVGGGTTTTTYHRRPMSALYAYVQGKTDSRYLKLSGGTLTGWLVTTSHFEFKNNGYTKATNPSAETNQVIHWMDKGGYSGIATNGIASVYGGVSTAGMHYAILRAWKPDTSSTAHASLQMEYPKTGDPAGVFNCRIKTNKALHIYGTTSGNTASSMASGTAGLFSWGDTGPQITFDTNATPGGGQAGAIIFSDHDNAGTGVSWHFVSNQSDWIVTSKRFHARTGISVGTDLHTNCNGILVKNGYNLVLRGAGANDPGDLIFQGSDGTEKGRVFSNGTSIYFRMNSTDGNICYFDSTNAIFQKPLWAGYSTQSALPSTGIHVHDCRSVQLTPGTGDQAANFYFLINGTGSNTMPAAGWWSVLHVKGWTGGYSSWELAGPANNSDQRTTPLYVRTSNINSAWGSWRQIMDSSGGTFTGDVAFKGSQYTTVYFGCVGSTIPTATNSASFFGDTSESIMVFRGASSSVSTGIQINSYKYTTSNLQLKLTNGGAFLYFTYSNTAYRWVDSYMNSSTKIICFGDAAAITRLYGSSIYMRDTSTAVTSDRLLKKDFTKFDSRYETFFMNINPTLYKSITGTSDRFHSGFIAQEVEEALSIANIPTQSFAGLVIDTTIDTDYEKQLGYNPFEGINKQYYLRYTEFISLNTWMIQKNYHKLSAHELRIQQLEQENEILKQRITALEKQFTTK